MSTPPKQCDRLDSHDEHEWYDGPLRRQCSGHVDAEFRALLDEFIEANDETLRRLAALPDSYLGAGSEPSPREAHEAKLRETGAIE